MAIQFAIVNLIHSRRVRRRNLSAKGCPPLFAIFVCFAFKMLTYLIR
ncbi:MAG: hypothetical protein LBK82_09170 [Planctomycetaceae bacterium]|nr:hypothetical protein [Planctomycetaceae bacterium]